MKNTTTISLLLICSLTALIPGTSTILAQTKTFTEELSGESPKKHSGIWGKVNSVFNNPERMKGNSFFGYFNAGYSNLGIYGSFDVAYRKENRFFSAGYSKSHICFLNIDKGDFSHTTKASDNHVTVQTFTARMGVITQRILFLSCGLSYSRFEYERTLPMTNILSVQSVWNTALNKNYGETEVSTDIVHAVGIPLEVKLNFSPHRLVGFTTGAMVYINSEQTIVSAEIGVRFGRIARK